VAPLGGGDMAPDPAPAPAPKLKGPCMQPSRCKDTLAPAPAEVDSSTANVSAIVGGTVAAIMAAVAAVAVILTFLMVGTRSKHAKSTGLEAAEVRCDVGRFELMKFL
jgi:hypothetical protein